MAANELTNIHDLFVMLASCLFLARMCEVLLAAHADVNAASTGHN